MSVWASLRVMPCELYFCTPELNCRTNAHTSHMAGTESVLLRPPPAAPWWDVRFPCSFCITIGLERESADEVMRHLTAVHLFVCNCK